MKTQNFLILFCLILVQLYSLGCKSDEKDLKTSHQRIKVTPIVDGYIVQPSTVKQTINVSGTLKPFEETVLMSEVSGRIVSLNLPEGKTVQKGTLLVKLFDGDLQANLAKLKAQLEIAQQTQKRQAELMKVNGISQLDYDQALLQVNSINADIAVTNAQIRKTEIMAPYDGVIGLRNVSLGAEVNPQTALATLRVTDKLKLDFSVPEKYSTGIKKDLNVNFSINGLDEKFTAIVYATEQSIDAATRNLKVRASVVNKTEKLTPGAFAEVELILNEHNNALMIPTQAIIPAELTKRIIIARNGKTEFTMIKTGVRQSSLIEVVQGIQAGDTVVTSGLLFLKPGMDVKFSKIVNR